jgi:uncharacterized protein (TIGR02284 family)
MENDKTIEVLNALITINNDRIEGYGTASKNTDEEDLINLFAQFISTSYKCKQELVNEVIKIGGIPAEGTKTTGKFYRIWMEVKSALTNKDRKVILSSCEFGEEMALNTYSKVVSNNISAITAEQQTMLYAQHYLIISDRDKVNSMRNMLEAEACI